MDNILSSDEICKMTEKFLYNFSDRYPGSGPIPYFGSLSDALQHSVFDPTTPCPLILYIHHDKSIAVNIFCRYVLCDEKITNLLAEQFLVWTWDRTKEKDYSTLLKMLHQYTTKEVATTVTSFPVDAYPLLVCLSVHQEQIDIVSTIQSTMTRDETLIDLIESRKKFDRRTELPHSQMLNTKVVTNENQSELTYVLNSVTKPSSIIEQIIRDFHNSYMKIVSINEVKSGTWLTRYMEQKKIMDDRLGHDQSEQYLFHGCSRLAAEGIIKHGFDHKLIGMHGTAYGHGFYFSSSPLISHQYSTPDLLNNNERTILVCRVLVGQTCSGNYGTRTCPDGYDSTTGGFGIYVIYSNRQILPAYIITCKDKFNSYEDKTPAFINKQYKTGFCNIL